MISFAAIFINLFFSFDDEYANVLPHMEQKIIITKDAG